MLSMSNAKMLINAFMTWRLDYFNALLDGCCARLINKLQMVQNTAARVLTRIRKYDHISPVMSTLHWLPIKKDHWNQLSPYNKTLLLLEQTTGS